jgi:hypothetical protein
VVTGRPPHAYVNRRLQIQLELLMISGLPLETCYVFNKRWNNKFCYKVASCWLFLLNHIGLYSTFLENYLAVDIHNMSREILVCQMLRKLQRQLTYVGVVLSRSARDIKRDLASTSTTDGLNYTLLSAKTYMQVR